MASRRGMTLRNEDAQGRIDVSLAVLAAGRSDLPERPDRSRDPFLNETLHLEWTADVLEVLAGTAPGDAPGIVETVLDREALKERKLAELKDLALDAGADADAVAKARSKDDVLDLLEAEVGPEVTVDAEGAKESEDDADGEGDQSAGEQPEGGE